MPLYEVIIPLAILSIPLYVAARNIRKESDKKKRINKIFEEASKKYGCTLSKGNIFYFPRFFGTVQGMSLNVGEPDLSSREYFQVTLKFTAPFEGKFLIETIQLFRETKKMDGRDFQIGDPSFDQGLLLSSKPPSLLLALLKEEERKRITELSAGSGSFKLKNNLLQCRYPTGTLKESESFINTIEQFILTAKNISQCGNIQKRLIDNLMKEPVPKVASNIIKCLATEYRGDEETIQACSQALKHKSRPVQIEAARHLGAEGMQHLCKMLDRGKTSLPEDDITIIKALAFNGWKDSTVRLEKKYHETENIDLKKAIIGALREFKEESSEKFLVEELQKSDSELQEKIIEALGFCGTPAGAEKLYYLGKESMNPFTRRDIQKAIDRIHTRYNDLDKGWLSVAEPTEKEGALSRDSSTPEGGLSIDEANKNTTKNKSSKK